MSGHGDSAESKKPLYREIDADDDVPEITEVESMCMSCEEQGTTRVFLTKIPFFKDIIIMSFDCPHCGYRDNQIQPGSDIQEKGIRITLKVDGAKMMNRQIVKQGSAMFRVEELDFEAPAFTSKGSLTTVEGLLETAASGLQDQQPVRKIMQPEIAEKIDEIIEKLTKYRAGETPFTLMLEDSSGNSFIENPFAPKDDPSLTIEFFDRTPEQNSKLGMSGPEEEQEQHEQEEQQKEENAPLNLKDEVLEFPSNCQSCQTPTAMRMKVVDIPHFKEVVIMASSCDACGYKSNDVKAGGAMEPLGTRIEFIMTHVTDLTRDVLSSETCIVSIPEFDLTLSHSSMGGRFTTLEGLLVNVREQLGRTNPFAFGDSSEASRMKGLVENIDKVIEGKLFVKIILDDPIGNSYLQNIYAPDPDPNITIEKYQRTEEQDLELGISDMRTENY